MVVRWLTAAMFLAMPIAAGAFSPDLPGEGPLPAIEDCCGDADMDTDHTFRGYPPELWDDAPSMAMADCSDDACLVAEADRLLRLYRLQGMLEARAAAWRAEHMP